MSVALETLKNAWLVACPSAGLRRRPLSRVVLGVPIVLFRAGGRAAALVDRCPHRNAALSQGCVRGETIECGYHGWTFDAGGECRSVPGLLDAAQRPGRRARAVHVAERDGFVWVCLAEPSLEPPLFPVRRYPALDDPAFDNFVWTTQAQCSLVDGLENLLDAQHPHFVHPGLVRTAQRRRRVAVAVRREGDVIEAVYTENRMPEGLVAKLFEGWRTASIGRYFPPVTAQLEYRGPRGPRFLLTATFTPRDERSALIHSVLSTPKGRVPALLKRLVMRAAFEPILRQDRDVLRRQQANIERFGGPHYASTPLDVMRPHLLHFLSREASPTAPPFETTLDMEL